MRPLTDDNHKALLSIAGVTILGRILDGLLRIGIDDIVVVTGYREADVREFLSRRTPRRRGSRFVHNARYDTTNNIVSLALAFV